MRAPVITSASHPAQRLTAVTVIAILGLFLASLVTAGAARATHDPKSVHLHGPHRGASSASFQQGGGGDCANTPEGQVVWHFIANKLANDSTLTAFTATFDDDGARGADTSWNAGPKVVHIYASTDGHDTLLDATATFNKDQPTGHSGAMLVLSHVCVGAEAASGGNGDNGNGGNGDNGDNGNGDNGDNGDTTGGNGDGDTTGGNGDGDVAAGGSEARGDVLGSSGGPGSGGVLPDTSVPVELTSALGGLLVIASGIGYSAIRRGSR